MSPQGHPDGSCPVNGYHNFEVLTTLRGHPAYVYCRACRREWPVSTGWYGGP